MGTYLDRIDEPTLFRFIKQTINTQRQAWIGNLNVHAVNLAVLHEDIRHTFNQADLVFCDGKGLALALRALGLGHFEQITYHQWLPKLLAYCHEHQYTLYFLGGEHGLAEDAMALANARFPGVVVGSCHGYLDRHETAMAIEHINDSGADILLVGMGMPMQEQFISHHRQHINVSILLNAGNALRFYTGQSKVAPAFLARAGMEWFYRMLQEPRRLTKRYLLGNPFFIVSAILWRLSQRLHPDEFVLRPYLPPRPTEGGTPVKSSNVVPWHNMKDRNNKQRFAKTLTNTVRLRNFFKEKK